jgi:hypothetical protein
MVLYAATAKAEELAARPCIAMDDKGNYHQQKKALAMI